MTHPVVPAHGVKAVGPADEDKVIVPGNQNFNKVMALVLKKKKKKDIRTPTQKTRESLSHISYFI